MGEVDANRLRFWADKVVRDPEMLAEDRQGRKLGSTGFQPPISKTFCNIAVQRILRGCGYDCLDGKTANQIYDHCLSNWARCVEEDARSAANSGDLVLACWKNQKGHGHVAVVYPDKGPMIFSGKWNCYTVKVANVGQKNDVIGANFAFSERPEYFRAMRVQ